MSYYDRGGSGGGRDNWRRDDRGPSSSGRYTGGSYDRDNRDYGSRDQPYGQSGGSYSDERSMPSHGQRRDRPPPHLSGREKEPREYYERNEGGYFNAGTSSKHYDWEGENRDRGLSQSNQVSGGCRNDRADWIRGHGDYDYENSYRDIDINRQRERSPRRPNSWREYHEYKTGYRPGKNDGAVHECRDSQEYSNRYVSNISYGPVCSNVTNPDSIKYNDSEIHSSVSFDKREPLYHRRCLNDRPEHCNDGDNLYYSNNDLFSRESAVDPEQRQISTSDRSASFSNDNWRDNNTGRPFPPLQITQARDNIYDSRLSYGPVGHNNVQSGHMVEVKSEYPDENSTESFPQATFLAPEQIKSEDDCTYEVDIKKEDNSNFVSEENQSVDENILQSDQPMSVDEILQKVEETQIDIRYFNKKVPKFRIEIYNLPSSVNKNQVKLGLRKLNFTVKDVLFKNRDKNIMSHYLVVLKGKPKVISVLKVKKLCGYDVEIKEPRSKNLRNNGYYWFFKLKYPDHNTNKQSVPHSFDFQKRPETQDHQNILQGSDQKSQHEILTHTHAVIKSLSSQEYQSLVNHETNAPSTSQNTAHNAKTTSTPAKKPTMIVPGKKNRIRVFIKNLPMDYPREEIPKYFKKIGFKAVTVNRFQPLKVFILQLLPSPNILEIFDVTKVNGIDVEVVDPLSMEKQAPKYLSKARYQRQIAD